MAIANILKDLKENMDTASDRIGNPSWKMKTIKSNQIKTLDERNADLTQQNKR